MSEHDEDRAADFSPGPEDRDASLRHSHSDRDPRSGSESAEGGGSTDYGVDEGSGDADSEDGSISTSDGDLNFEDLSDDAEGPTSAAATREYTDVGSYTSYEAAQDAVESWNGLVYLYDTRYETHRVRARVYVCRSHVACEHRLKITSTTNGDGETSHVVSEAEHHGRERTGTVRRGIHPQLRDEVDSLLQLGMGGQELRNVLEHRYQDNPAMAALLPTARQLTNRKAFISRNAPGGWDLRNFAAFNAWAGGRMCTTRDAFEEVTEEGGPRMDAFVILDTFVFDGETAEDPTTFGVIVTSRRVFRNVHTSVRDQGRELVCSTDGTYKLHFGGWTVVDCGSVGVTWSRQAYTHRFIPWVYMFVRTESTDAYARMFDTIRTRARTFFDVSVDVAFGTMDHSDAIASAFEATWPRVRVLTCWPHLMRQARKKRTLLSDSDVFDDLIKPQLQLLESARSHAQFLWMSVIITTGWIEAGERAYADWFRAVYLTRRWERWHINAAGVPGIVASQQSIEAHHRVIKRTCAPHTRASTGGVMSGILPRILTSDGATLCPLVIGLFCQGPLPPEMLLKAHFHQRCCSRPSASLGPGRTIAASTKAGGDANGSCRSFSTPIGTSSEV